MPRVRRKDIRMASLEEQERIYQEVLELSHQKGLKVVIKAHRSGFPAVTLDCGDLHYLTDCLSMEDFSRKQGWAKEKADGAD